jgi:hypothetical protein
MSGGLAVVGQVWLANIVNDYQNALDEARRA